MELNWRHQSSELMLVTPLMAAAWLQLHNKSNRDIKPSVVEQYSRDLQANRWPLTHQGVGFDWNGQLVDGQHRLTAIMRTGISAHMYVTTGLDPLVRSIVDIHSKRSVHDALMFAGRRVKCGTIPTNSVSGMWSRMLHGIAAGKGGETRQELLTFEETHAEAGNFALDNFGKYPRYRWVQISPVMAAVARAYYHIGDHHRLAAFVEVLMTGIQKSPEDQTAVYWRTALTTGKVRGNSNLARDLYGKTCRAIQAFCRRDVITKFYVPAEEPFPLPSRSAAETTPSAHRVAANGGQLFGGGSGASRVVDLSR